LKKQSQFLKVKMIVSVYLEGDYEPFIALGRRKIKANRQLWSETRNLK